MTRRVPCEQGSQVRATSSSDQQLATCLGRAADACEARLQLAGPAECGVSGSVRGVCARHGLARGAEPLRLAPALNGHCVRCCRARGAARASWAAATTMATAVRRRGGTCHEQDSSAEATVHARREARFWKKADASRLARPQIRKRAPDGWLDLHDIVTGGRIEFQGKVCARSARARAGARSYGALQPAQPMYKCLKPLVTYNLLVQARSAPDSPARRFTHGAVLISRC